MARCPRCGTRRADVRGGTRLLFTCDRCGLPFLAEALLPHQEQQCGPCERGEPLTDLPSAGESAATEAELLDAVSGRWRFATSEAPAGYVGRLVRQLGERMDTGLARIRVAFLDDPGVMTLALPAGTIVVSRGTLEALEDEAELVFLLAHEVAHAASGDAAVLLGRMGFRAAAREATREDGRGWADAAEDILLLGYGRKRERDADARAAEAMLSLGYDTDSAIRLLARLDAHGRAGDPALAAYATAHPTAPDRIRRLERALYGRVAAAGGKVNREVFRRVVSSAAWSATGGPTTARAERRRRSEPGVPSPRAFGRWLLAAGILGALALLAAALIARFG